MLEDDSTSALIVDDQSSIRKLIRHWLTLEGYQCTEAESTRQASEHLQSHEFPLVILDVRMPGGSGNVLLRRIAEKYPDTSVVMMTGQDDAHTAIDALTHGACAYLLKPVEREELLFHVRRALERRQLLLERRDYTNHLEERVREQTLAVRQAQEETIHRLVSASLWRDEETGMHIRRTGLLSECLAKAAGWSISDAELLRMAAPMHDVGKIGIPDAILRKPGPLTPEEFTIMQTHTTIGARILAGSKTPMLRMAEQIAIGHHEQWDGAGYPDGVSGLDIPECARIVAIIDVYDALTHDRVYRPALPEDQVLDLMQRNGGVHFDPGLLALFFTHYSIIAGLAAANPDHPPVACLAQGDVIMSHAIARC